MLPFRSMTRCMRVSPLSGPAPPPSCGQSGTVKPFQVATSRFVGVSVGVVAGLFTVQNVMKPFPPPSAFVASMCSLVRSKSSAGWMVSSSKPVVGLVSAVMGGAPNSKTVIGPPLTRPALWMTQTFAYWNELPGEFENMLAVT